MHSQPKSPANLVGMGDEVFQICESCRQEVKPGDPGVVEAATILTAETFGGSQRIEGLHVFFHEGCFPTGSPNYRRLP
jgi:hypothetical protein